MDGGGNPVRTARRSRRHAVWIAAVVAGGFAVNGPSPAQAETVDFGYTGSVEQWTVPPDVHEISVTLCGAAGGYFDPGKTAFNVGGLGARVTAEVAVTPGESSRSESVATDRAWGRPAASTVAGHLG